METFDKYVGVNNYRENSFLLNPSVPESVTQSLSPYLLIKTKTLNRMMKSNQYNPAKIGKYTSFIPKNLSSGPSKQAVQSWFAAYEKYSVLRLQSLYGVYPRKRKNYIDSSYDKVISKAFVKLTYRQF